MLLDRASPPIATFKLPVVFAVIAEYPTAVLLSAVVLASNANEPTATLFDPVVFDTIASWPIPTFSAAVVVAEPD